MLNKKICLQEIFMHSVYISCIVNKQILRKIMWHITFWSPLVIYLTLCFGVQLKVPVQPAVKRVFGFVCNFQCNCTSEWCACLLITVEVDMLLEMNRKLNKTLNCDVLFIKLYLQLWNKQCVIFNILTSQNYWFMLWARKKRDNLILVNLIGKCENEAHGIYSWVPVCMA